MAELIPHVPEIPPENVAVTVRLNGSVTFEPVGALAVVPSCTLFEMPAENDDTPARTAYFADPSGQRFLTSA